MIPFLLFDVMLQLFHFGSGIGLLSLSGCGVLGNRSAHAIRYGHVLRGVFSSRKACRVVANMQSKLRAMHVFEEVRLERSG